jgi:hypothetical protein
MPLLLEEAGEEVDREVDSTSAEDCVGARPDIGAVFTAEGHRLRRGGSRGGTRVREEVKQGQRMV